MACGDPLVGGDYRGEPLIVISGEVLSEAPLGEQAETAAVALIWESGPNQRPLAHQSVSIETDFPSSYTLSVYQPPPEDLLDQSPFGDGAVVVVGLIVLYEDADQDRVYSAGSEEVLGAAARSALIWVEEPPAEHPERDHFYFMAEEPADRCDPGATPAPLEPTDGAGVDLVVGISCELIIDPDCQPDTESWGPICER
jgi:hypothetical protein